MPPPCRRLDRNRAVLLVALGLLNVLPSLASVLPSDTTPAASSKPPYLHSFGRETYKGPAYEEPSLEDLAFLDLVLPEEGVNPAPAWSRHPLVAPPVPHRQVPGKRDIITASEAPWPPAAYVDINNLTTIALISQAAVARMQTWYEDGLYQWTAWWQVPVLGMAYANLDLALGNQGNKLLIEDLLNKNSDLGYMIDDYIDDQSWWGMFALRGYELYGNETWLEATVNISVNNTLYWDDSCGGGVLWLTWRPLIKNTITNGLHFSMLARLYRYTGNSSYYDEALRTLNWWLGWAFEPSTGRVYDTINSPDCVPVALESWTYNSGAFLFGLADLFYATGNETLLDLGRSIAYAAIRDFSMEGTGILEEGCETDPQPSPDLPPGCQQDELVFKGILVMGMSELYLARPDQNIYNYINTQLLSVVWNNVDETWLFGQWWEGPWNETTAGPKTQVNTLCLLSAAATINADFLARADADARVNVTNQVGVPGGVTEKSGNAGSTARDNSGERSGRPSWFAGLGLVVVVGLGLLFDYPLFPLA